MKKSAKMWAIERDGKFAFMRDGQPIIFKTRREAKDMLDRNRGYGGSMKRIVRVIVTIESDE